MAEKDVEVPEDRCGFELQPDDVGFTGFGHAWENLTSPVCCWQPIWKSHDDTDHCIWHADVDEKPLEELITIRADSPERLDGAILRHLIVEGKALSFGDCSLLGARFDKSNLPDIDFTGMDLHWATFTDADLTEADFTGANLKQTDFTDANLEGANFTKAIMIGADLIDATLVEVDFTNALLYQTDFSDVDLPHIDFTDGNLAEADFIDATLFRANFTDADLYQADFTDADLTEADFTDAHLFQADFIDTLLDQADFTNADLRGTNFTNADLRGADLSDADLRGTDFTDADLRDAELSDADAREANFRHANLQDTVFTRTDCREATFTSALLYETVFADTRINSQTTFFDPEATFYDSITSRPACVYEENPLVTNHLPEYTTNYLLKNEHPLEAARWVYRRLETLHEDNALSEAARGFHISKEEAERALYWKRGEYGPWAVKTLMWYLTRHGESVKRVLTWWGGVILTAGLLFAGLGGVTDAAGTEYAVTSLGELRTVAGWQDILMNIYFSVTTFSTIMDGGLAPAGTGTRAVVAVESITGALLVALLVFVLGRRTAR